MNQSRSIKVVLFNKPYGVHSQFRRDNDTMHTLADFFEDKSLRVVGRLDADSEGLLLLTNHGALNHAIASPPKDNHQKQPKRYLVQVEGIPTTEQIQMLANGVMLKDGKTLPANVIHLDETALPITLWVRTPPIRERQSIPTAWLSITIYEGKNRQVRRMTAHVGLPCLRLIRYQVAGFTLDTLASGESVCLQLSPDELAVYGVSLPQEKKMGKNGANNKAKLIKDKQSPRLIRLTKLAKTPNASTTSKLSSAQPTPHLSKKPRHL
ncbi:MAG: pseudouridine synthase [Moraxella sp.]|nr:pseudouridine synthase [Moraxella sp.]